MISRKILLVLFFVSCAIAKDIFEHSDVREALKLYEYCSNAGGFSPCLKKKAITFLDRLERMDEISLADGVTVSKSPDAPKEGALVTEEQLEKTLPRSGDDKDEILTNMLMEKITNFIGSRTLQVSLPKISGRELAEDLEIEEGRDGFGGGGGGKKKGGGGGKKGGMKGMMIGMMKGMMKGMMMGSAVKMFAMVPLGIGGIFLLAKKALIIAKIALLLSGIMAVKKLLGSKQGGGGGHSSGGHGSGGHSSGGHGSGGHSSGGWQSNDSGGHGGAGNPVAAAVVDTEVTCIPVVATTVDTVVAGNPMAAAGNPVAADITKGLWMNLKTWPIKRMFHNNYVFAYFVTS
ncbi:hypothetical protein JTB14_011674 [Gonioctena quinquepunctata]|nr:hypothetical protein JTB14_011674 [Gonioctena quinquepunctata]